jgi:two-component system sensor histidine kinase KdpD
MDLDALLARRPRLALVDEFAHTNAPGSRHPKRYQDVEELLETGVDVLTTVNIQHLESLNDVVARITRVRVRETLPDRIVDQADEVEVVDITPEELGQRLRDGKVYVPAQAERALEHFFQPGNLNALRELALRRTADRVDAQLRSYMRANAIEGPWAAGERFLVCVSELPGSAALVRATKRLADQFHAPWTAMHVETPRHQRLPDALRDRIADTLRLAEQLGAQTLSTPGDRIAGEVLAYARANNVTQVVSARRAARVGSGCATARSWASSSTTGTGSPSTSSRAAAARRGRRPTSACAPPPPARAGEGRDPKAYALAALMVAVALGVGYAADRSVGLSNEALVFIAPILLSATRDGFGPSLFAAVTSTLAYNFFFLEPYYGFSISDPSNVVAFVFFAVLAVATSGLAATARTRMVSARAQARTNAELYAFSRKLTGLADLDELLLATAHQIAAMLRIDAVVLLPDLEAGGVERGQLAVRAAWPPEDRIDEADLAAARWAWGQDRSAGRDSDTLPGARRLFLPMRTGRGVVGVLGITRATPGPLLSPDARRLLDALLDQTAIAVERVQLARRVDEDRLYSETERLRSTLLASVSHDLKTPLASILGTVTSLRSYGALYDDATREEMLATAQGEAERLGRFLDNVLDITRLQEGALGPKREPVDLADAAGAALRRAGRLLAGHRVRTDLPPDLPLLTLDFTLLEQSLVNLLENAAGHTPLGGTVEIAALRLPADDAGSVALEVRDDGPGVPPDEAERIFERFYRGRGGDRKGGTGLGLAVCRGFVEAMGGTSRPCRARDGREASSA